MQGRHKVRSPQLSVALGLDRGPQHLDATSSVCIDAYWPFAHSPAAILRAPANHEGVDVRPNQENIYVTSLARQAGRGCGGRARRSAPRPFTGCCFAIIFSTRLVGRSPRGPPATARNAPWTGRPGWRGPGHVHRPGHMMRAAPLLRRPSAVRRRLRALPSRHTEACHAALAPRTTWPFGVRRTHPLSRAARPPYAAPPRAGTSWPAAAVRARCRSIFYACGVGAIRTRRISPRDAASRCFGATAQARPAAQGCGSRTC